MIYIINILPGGGKGKPVCGFPVICNNNSIVKIDNTDHYLLFLVEINLNLCKIITTEVWLSH
jgi:hypothetical protein